MAAGLAWGQQVLLRVRFVQLDAAAEALLAPHLGPAEQGAENIRPLLPGLDLVTLLEDLRARGGGVRLLAEPNVMTSSAESATLLVGDAPQDLGIHLAMEPLKSGAGVRLRLRPSVPVVEKTRLTVPSITKRESQAEFRLEPGQSVFIGGLLDAATETLLRRLPLGNPLLDAILSHGGQAHGTIVVLVTPELL